MHRTFFAIAALAACTTGLVAQTTVNVPCRRDNTLYQNPNGDISNGAGSYLFVGVTGEPGIRRTLLWFDVAAVVPAGSRVLNVVLKLNVSRTSFFGSLPVQVHRALRSWGEGTSNAPNEEGRGTTATNGDATWIHAIRPGSLWSTPGGDFAPQPSTSSPVAGYGPATLFGGTLVADVQSWLDAPAGNLGWLLKTDEAFSYMTFRFDSRENAVATNRPTLTVTYLPPGASAIHSQGCIGSGGLPLRLDLIGTPVGGNSLQFGMSQGQPGALAANLLAVDFDATGTALYPSCRAFLPLSQSVTHNLFLLDGAGAGSTVFPLPPGFGPIFVAIQSAALDPALPAGFVLSNAGLAVVQ